MTIKFKRAEQQEFKMFMAANREDKDAYLYECLLDIKDNCARQCGEKKRLHPGITATGWAAFLIGMVETVKHLSGVK